MHSWANLELNDTSCSSNRPAVTFLGQEWQCSISHSYQCILLQAAVTVESLLAGCYWFLSTLFHMSTLYLCPFFAAVITHSPHRCLWICRRMESSEPWFSTEN
ncbi:hypothetical protein O6H91_20G047500 [Diphasiastrum complanatum]|uniref:Uncharacterized protein n=1 Tax=Diphasiastrum complanatum TaxID=34168 RepID=A0ACC2AQ32_DIPCM|nr:hypothetical protein O6H91_20G047500 [Diphasiastrum complanatum]